MEDQFSKREAQIDSLSQSLYVHQKQVRAIGTETLVAQTPIYNTPIADAVACCSSLDDEEMIHLLQYPTEDLMHRNYCSDIFGELPLSTFRISPETCVGKIEQAEEQFMAHAATMTASVQAEAAMELGFGRASGLVKQPGLEEFTKVRTTVQPPMPASSQYNVSSQSLNKCKEDSSSTFNLSHSRLLPLRSYPFHLPPRASLPPIDSCQINFPLFSLPAATDITNCSSGVISHIQHKGKYSATKGVNRTDDSTAESTTLVGQQPSKLFKESFNRHSYASGFTQNQGSQSGYQGSQGGYSLSHQHCSNVTDAQEQKKFAECKSEQQHLVICQNSATAGNVSDISSRCRPSPSREDSVGFTDLTLTTSWEGSGSLPKPCWKTRPSILKPDPKNDSRDMDVSTDCQCEDLAKSTDLKKQANGRVSTKRNRAAEVHNLSERRRRDRINERLKALQELIPNSDKSDKASILDEAIEYVKALQSQIQMMFLSSGIAIPATILPAKMQHLQMPQVAPLHHLRTDMGLGMGIGIEKGFPSFSTTTHATITGHPTIPLQSLTGSSSIANASSLHANHSSQSSGVVMDKCRDCSEHQPLEIPSQPMNINFWNAYMMHQPHYCQSHQGNQQNQQRLNVTQ